jgi:lipid-binding SYLF domain-containing protein
MKGLAVTGCLILSAGLSMAATEQDRLRDATEVLQEIMRTPDKGIPHDLLEKAQCVAIIPSVKKGAFIVGAEYGKGFLECRARGGGWKAPAAIQVEGGSFGFQIGGSSTDVVMLIMNGRGMEKLEADKFTLGADASVAAGPVGRTAAAQTDLQMSAEILSWSRTQGIFAGVALNGASVRPDMKGNEELYGTKMGTRDVLESQRMVPPEAQPLVAELDRYSMHKEGSHNAERSMEHDQNH